MLQNKNLIFDLFIRIIRKKLQWRLWRKFKNYLHCHNFRCVQDRVVIFGSRIVFGVGLIHGDIFDPVAMATKFGTKLATTRFV